jgi:tetratricopeptide (TPR) repeat protein
MHHRRWRQGNELIFSSPWLFLSVAVKKRRLLSFPVRSESIIGPSERFASALLNRHDFSPLRDALKVSASTASKFYEAAVQHMAAGRLVDAKSHCLQGLSLDPCHTDTLRLMGVLSEQAGQYGDAVEWISRAIRQNPKPDLLTDLGNILLRQGRKTEAVAVFDRAVQLKPDDAKLWRRLGDAMVEVDRAAEGVVCFQRALGLDPQNRSEVEKCGLLLHTLGRPEEALPYFRRCDEMQPGQAHTMFLLSRCLVDLKRFDEGLSLCLKAYNIDQSNAEICNVLGVALQGLRLHERALWFLDKAIFLRKDFTAAMNNRATSLGYFRRWEEVFSLLDRILELAPTDLQALVNKALYLAQVRRFDEAFEIYKRLEVIAPGNPDVEWNLSILLLLTGNLGKGFQANEARWKAQVRPKYPSFAEPKWSGEEPIKGKTVLIYAEEGLGDTLQLARYVPMVVALGAQVILVVGSAVRPLLANLPGVSACLQKPLSEPGVFDFHCPISSLPRIFRTELDTIPAGLPYLDMLPKARRDAWQDRLGLHHRMKIGLAWSGNPDNKVDHNRSISLDALSALLEVEATFFSLQKDPRPSDKALLSERSDIVDFTSDFTDFIETAALISCLDLVITVDTSIAHLAAGLGKRTWILVPYTPDPRWLLDRDDSPWYPTVRLFRQDERRDYATVLSAVKSELIGLINYSVFERSGDRFA